MANVGGEAESLWGKIDPKSFGDRAFHGRPPKKRSEDRESSSRPNKSGLQEDEEDNDSYFYVVQDVDEEDEYLGKPLQMCDIDDEYMQNNLGQYATRSSARVTQNWFKNLNEELQKFKDVVGDRDRDGECGWINGQRQMLNLENLSFAQGMAGKKCDLQDRSGKFSTDYYETNVPPKIKTFDPNEQLVNVSSLPKWAQPAFKGMEQLNRVQSKVYETALLKSDNLLVCAPTGCSKINVAVLAILQQIGQDMNHKDTRKIVYIAPMKALVPEVVKILSNRLQKYNIKVTELSGDQSITQQRIEDSHIIVTTPEKWDIVTRKSGMTYTKLVKLLIIDEILLLHDNRGPVLESLITRTVRQNDETTEGCIRLVGLSANLPNYKDVALFLRVDLEKGLFYFDNSYRPVPLRQKYVGITARKPLERFMLMNDICYEEVKKLADGHQVLIFVHSWKDTTRTARAIRDAALGDHNIGTFLKQDSASILLDGHSDDGDLKDFLRHGFAIHHAGMTRNDQDLVKRLFTDGHVKVLVSTATLAWGVSRPVLAHTVIIKGTQIYNPEKGAWTELSPLDVMQMLGCAGRPQHDSDSLGIIVTEHSEVLYYKSLMNEQFHIESQFVSKLADQMNAEIVLGTVQNAKEACKWIQCTYLYFRMLRAPSLYGVAPEVLTRDTTLEERRADLIHTAATILDRNNLVKYDRKNGYFQVTDLGRIASNNHVTYETISLYNARLEPTMGIVELCQLFSQSTEFKYVTVTPDEKMELAKLLDLVPIQVLETLEEPSAKINVLLQKYITRSKLKGLSLTSESDMFFIAQSAERLVRALFEIVLKRGLAQLTEFSLNLWKMVSKRMWSVEDPLRQFNANDQFPHLCIKAHFKPITRTALAVKLVIETEFTWDDRIHGFVESFWVIVEDNDGEYILHHEYLLLKKTRKKHTLSFMVPIQEEPCPHHYSIRLVSNRWLGVEDVVTIGFGELTLPEKCPPPTKLSGQAPLPVFSLQNSSYEALYSDLKHFNPVQTHVFTVLYNSDKNVLVAAPTGSGKIICAELAILRNHQERGHRMHVVYVAPIETLAKKRYHDWVEKFGHRLKLKVVELTGETATDQELIRKGHIFIGTAEKWDALSRHRKHREHVKKVSLLIIDELQLIGGQGGPILEAVISRMRYVGSEEGNEFRIVALSTSLANAKDLGEWIGATSHDIFNFPPGARPVPLEIDIQGVDIADFEARMHAMTKPTYTSVAQHTKNGENALVFVPTREHVWQTAMDLVTNSVADSGEKPFLLQSTEDVQRSLGDISDERLKSTLLKGVGYLHEGLNSRDHDIVTQFFEAGCIKVCILSSSMCWGVTLSAHLVVVMGTQYYDGWDNAQTDYSVTDLLQMMDHASCPFVDNSGKCVILCHAPRKAYYKKFLHEALPVESHLDFFHLNFLNVEIVAGVIKNVQGAVDYLKQMFTYKRLTKNPSYYSLGLEELETKTAINVRELIESKFVEATNSGTDLSPLFLGELAAHCCISCQTVQGFSLDLNKEMKMKDVLELLSRASEYEQLPMRLGEEEEVRRLFDHQKFSSAYSSECQQHIKANALLQAHFSRQILRGNLLLDQREVLLLASRLLQAMIGLISREGWLSLALLTMKVSQMVTQGMWTDDSLLLQIPHFTKDLAKKWQEEKIQAVIDLIKIEDDERKEFLSMTKSQLQDITQFCNRFPNIDLEFEVLTYEIVRVGQDVVIEVTLVRDLKGKTEVGPVDSPRYPKAREEGWWLVVGDTESDRLLALERVLFQGGKFTTRLKFAAPTEAGVKIYALHLISDSYMGCDQKRNVNFEVNMQEGGGDRDRE